MCGYALSQLYLKPASSEPKRELSKEYLIFHCFGSYGVVMGWMDGWQRRERMHRGERTMQAYVTGPANQRRATMASARGYHSGVTPRRNNAHCALRIAVSPIPFRSALAIVLRCITVHLYSATINRTISATGTMQPTYGNIVGLSNQLLSEHLQLVNERRQLLLGIAVGHLLLLLVSQR